MALPVPRHRKLGLRRRADDAGGSDGQLTTRDEHSQSPSAASATTRRGASFARSGSQVRDVAASARASPISSGKHASVDVVTEADVILSGMQSTSDHLPTPQTVQIDDIPLSAPKSLSGPVIVSSSSAMRPPSSVSGTAKRAELGIEGRQSKERSRIPTPDKQPQHFQGQPRQAGRGRGRGNNRGSVPSGFPPNYGAGSSGYNTGNNASSGQWPHDMHKPAGDTHFRRPRYMTGGDEGPFNGNGIVYRCKDSDTPINRTLSTERHVGNAQIRVYLPHMEEAVVFPAIPLKQYTKLPDHRPPLRQDKPVRISLPERAPRYIYPALDRSFTFIPRAMRPNQQQRLRGRPRSNWSSAGGYSRRNSVFGGSHYGSVYSPSANHSRRSSVVFDREHMFSPTSSIISRPPMAMDNSRPVVRLPPGIHGGMEMHYGQNLMDGQPGHVSYANSVTSDGQSSGLPMYQPQPQKNISVADIDSPAVLQGNHGFQQAFHQQMPLQTQDAHGRRLSHSSQQASGTPLSHIAERTHHGTPFRQNMYQQQQQQQYYYTAGYPAQNYQGDMFYQPMQYGDPTGQYSGYSMPHMAGPGMIAQEMNGMVYFYDPSQAQAQTQGAYGQRQYPNTPQMHGGMMYYPQ